MGKRVIDVFASLACGQTGSVSLTSMSAQGRNRGDSRATWVSFLGSCKVQLCSQHKLIRSE